MLWLLGVALLVGILIGAVRVGGILLIPALNLLTPLSIQASMATALFGFIGSWANALLDARLLAILPVLIVFAGIYTLCSVGSRPAAGFHDRPRLQQLVLFGIGAVTGFGSSLTGVGGPALAVPLLVLFGFPALAAIGASQVIQVLVSVSGSIGHLA